MTPAEYRECFVLINSEKLDEKKNLYNINFMTVLPYKNVEDTVQHTLCDCTAFLGMSRIQDLECLIYLPVIHFLRFVKRRSWIHQEYNVKTFDHRTELDYGLFHRLYPVLYNRTRLQRSNLLFRRFRVFTHLFMFNSNALI